MTKFRTITAIATACVLALTMMQMTAFAEDAAGSPEQPAAEATTAAQEEMMEELTEEPTEEPDADFLEEEMEPASEPETEAVTEPEPAEEAVSETVPEPAAETTVEAEDGIVPTEEITEAVEMAAADAEISAKAAATSNPAAPAIKVARKGPSLFVSWASVQGANYYEVYRSYKYGKIGKRIKTVKGKLYYTDSKVASGKKAYYTVRAHKSTGGFTRYSAAVSGIIYRVYIETGHGISSTGAWDSGCKWKKYQEAKLMIPICKSMTKYLRSKGVYVYTDAFNGNKTNLFWVLKRLKGYNVSVFVNVHCDYKNAPRGTMPLYRYKNQKKLAKCLNNGVHKTVKIKNRGLKKRKDLDTLNKTRSYCVACLFETGNIKKDNKILRKKYDAYGKGLAMGVCSYLGVKW